MKKEKDFIDAYNNWLADIEKMISKGRLLEIGSALGYFLEAARRRGWEVYGVEVSSGGVRCCKERYGIDAFCGEIKEAGIPSGYFDCIVTLHTLEHVYDPMELMSECYRVLRPGGLIVIEIPYLKYADARNSDVLDDIPMHLNFFTVETLETLLNKAGFVCLEIAKGENLQIYAKRAVNSQSIHDKSKAVSVYERMLSTGEEFFKKGLYLESLRMFNIMKDLFEDDAAVLNNIGAVLWAIGEQEQAMRIIEHTLKMDCRYWDALMNLIQMLRQFGRDGVTHQYVECFESGYPDSVWSRKLQEIVGS
jgi:SAM-dependent methyltransferase